MKSFYKPFWIALLLLGVLFQAELRAETNALGGGPSSPAQTVTPRSSALPAPDEMRVEISRLDGVVMIQKMGAQDFVDSRTVKKIRAGDTIRADDGSCRLTIDGKIFIDVWPQTTLKITSALRHRAADRNDATEISMLSGQIRAKVNNSKMKVGSIFEITTPTAVATVRGTTLFLKQGMFNGQAGSELYVDESSHGVNFLNLLSKKSFLVEAFSLSRALDDGSLDPPTHLTKEQQEDFIKNWNQNSGGHSQQFGIEEIPLNNPAPIPPAVPDSFGEAVLNDALLEHLSEQNVPGVNGLPLPGSFGPGLTAPKEPPKEDGGSGTQNPPDQGGGTENPPPAEEEPTPDELLEQQERRMIREEIGKLLGDQDFDHADAHLAQIADSQTGKVFTDVHGNRVRVDQYIFQDTIGGQSSVNLLSLTARTGSYQNGVSSLQFSTIFNRLITTSDGPLKDLPWNDWMRIVGDNQLTGIEEDIPYEQFIVHEHYSNTETAPDLYPEALIAFFLNPGTTPETAGAMIIAEGYSAPERVQSDQGNFWVQGMVVRSIGAVGANGEALEVVESPFSPPLGFINGENVPTNDSDGESDGRQSAGLANDPRVTHLSTQEGVNAFWNSDIVPAHFEFHLADRILLGIFLPINDQGQVLDVPGFKINGLRDLVFPNPSVNGGNYNLEVLLLSGIDNGDSFSETFRIDTIITPEIFSNYGLKSVNGTRINDSIFFESDDQLSV